MGYKNIKNFVKLIFVVLNVAASHTAYAQWTPNSRIDRPFYYDFSPLCTEKRQQVRVRLREDANFLISENVPAGTILYGVTFKNVGLGSKGETGTSFCEPYQAKNLTLWSGHRANQINDAGIANGFKICFFDYNDDGVFDDSNTNVGGYRTKGTLPSRDQYPYEVLPSDGAVEPGCRRQKTEAAAIRVNEHVWQALTEEEKSKVEARGVVDIVPVREVGIIIQSQKINASTPGSNAAAKLGEAVASSKYIDKSINDGTYSAQGQLNSQLKGALLGSIFNNQPTSLFRVRYSLRLASGDIVTVDKNDKINDFVVANGVCVTIPFIEQTDQFLCDATLASFKETTFGHFEKPTSLPTQKEIRLRELKRLFEEKLLSESVYLEQQSQILKIE